MHPLNNSVRGGKVLYIAISDAPSSIISCENTIAELHGWSKHEKNWEILDEVINIATEILKLKKSPAQDFTKPSVISPVFGARTKAQIIENLKALDFKLIPDQMARLNSISQPKEIPFSNTMFP
ncbi:Aldo/keto reductase [Gigaspora margarita]|uniref:Aldo/keto reductase n=1 Tax=Gigaspora margarita TaxID=4874 RepID=A0A8H4AXG2_GIGMA|nr:Aldo/keto reductase [Gigaspora margarita]